MSKKIQKCEENMSDFISSVLLGLQPQTAGERWSVTTSAVLTLTHAARTNPLVIDTFPRRHGGSVKRVVESQHVEVFRIRLRGSSQTWQNKAKGQRTAENVPHVQPDSDFTDDALMSGLRDS